MKIVRNVLSGATALMLLAGLSACDSGASAVKAPKASERASNDIAPPPEGGANGGGRAADPRDAPVKLIAGKPYWAANRTRTAEENAQRSFERNGETFGAKTADDYVAKVHAFVSDPPKGSQTLKRSNGDLLIYDPKDNVFAVVSREGAPRTMFKPDEGAAYWDEQKTREDRRTSAARKREQAEG
jgi:pyocin large subunit-like protein